jgi:hypothetical protein
MHTVRISLGLGTLLLSLTGACVPCTPSVEPGISVRVMDQDTSAGTRLAVVTLTDGDYTETMQAPTCTCSSYTGAFERPGTYTIKVQQTGYVTQTINDVVVKAGLCHVQTVEKTVVMVPAS